MKSMSTIGRTIGANIKLIRRKALLTQVQLAGLIGCAQTYVGQIERGQRGLTVETLEKLATALEVPIERLLQRDAEPSSLQEAA
jgi:XRE family transcriptional regulator, regulator of sulfur utilization